MGEVNVQKTTGCNEIKINVKPAPVNPVVIENSYRGIDYNVLKNKPKIEGNELIGDKTAKELLGFDKTDMDATIAVAQGAEDVANASNAKATQAYETATEAKQIAQAVDTKATNALTNSATALEKATQAKNTADSYQGQITTLRNDVDDLGDQVATIEGKIPAEATTANQLADKEFVTTITDELAADITALDADVQKINLIKWVDTLPATGETKYLYAVAREEVDKDGHKIAALYLWDGTEWRGAGAFSLNIDPDTLATKNELAGFLPLSGGTLTGQLKILKNSLLISSSDDTKYVGISMGNDGFAYFSSKVYIPSNSVVGTSKILGNSDKAVANGVASLDENAKVPSAQIPTATASTIGGVKPDGTTIIVKADGTISNAGSAIDGIKGDYCTTYGIIDAPNGILTNPSGMEVVLKQGVVLQLAGQDIKTTISGDMAHTITSTADCDLFYVSGTASLMEVAQIVWSRVEPDNGQAGVLAWWNPDNKKWKFKSNDTGNVWAEAVATPVAHIHTNGTTITRIDHIGFRVLDDEVYALKSETNTALAGKANTDLSNVLANIDYVVDYKKPTDSDPTWYRKYKSGWLEQGGITGIVADFETATITLPLQFLDTHYTVSYANWRAGTTDDGTWNNAAILNNSTKSTTSFQIYSRGKTDGGKIFTWHACGQGAN